MTIGRKIVLEFSFRSSVRVTKLDIAVKTESKEGIVNTGARNHTCTVQGIKNKECTTCKWNTTIDEHL